MHGINETLSRLADVAAGRQDGPITYGWAHARPSHGTQEAAARESARRQSAEL